MNIKITFLVILSAICMLILTTIMLYYNIELTPPRVLFLMVASTGVAALIVDNID